MLAYSRPFWPLFLHVLGAMVLVGAMLAVLLLTLAAWRDSKPLSRAAPPSRRCSSQRSRRGS